MRGRVPRLGCGSPLASLPTRREAKRLNAVVSRAHGSLFFRYRIVDRAFIVRQLRNFCVF